MMVKNGLKAVKPLEKVRIRPNKAAEPPPGPRQDPKTGRFVLGNAGNGGRKLGTRRDLEMRLVDSVVRDFAEHGERVIERVREEDPATYLRIAAGLLPKELHVNVAHDLSIESFAERFKDLIARATGKPLSLLEAAQSPTNDGVCKTLDLKPNPVEEDDEPAL
jgi:hypothetical protein